MIEIKIEQGSESWIELRKTKITSTDASVIMGINPWKKIGRLLEEKKGHAREFYRTEKMQRGVDLEPVARNLYSSIYDIDLTPKVFIKDWAMASVDAINSAHDHLVEIKCPGERDHAKALRNDIPEYYYPQLQHQMHVCDLDHMYYFSFDGFFGHRIFVKRADDYIKILLEKEKEFYDSIFDLEVNQSFEILS